MKLSVQTIQPLTVIYRIVCINLSAIVLSLVLYTEYADAKIYFFNQNSLRDEKELL